MVFFNQVNNLTKKYKQFLVLVLLVQTSIYSGFSAPTVVNHTAGSSGVIYTGCDFEYYYNGSTFPTSTGNNINKIVNFQAPSGTCLSVTFFVFSTETIGDCDGNGVANDPCDYLEIFTGLNATGTQLGGSGFKFYGSNNPGFRISTTGVLSFRFKSDGSGIGSGWYAKINCTCPSTSNAISQDCAGALPFCSSVGGTPSTLNGSTNDLNSSNRGCLSTGEKYGAWYRIIIETSGIMKLAIDPSSSHDYDFALWGPNKLCGDLGAPLRCSYSPPAGTVTGMSTSIDQFMTGTESYGAVGASEDNSTYDDWVTEVNVIAGQRYLLFVGDYTASAPISGFQMTLGGTAGYSCNVALGIDLFKFEGAQKGGVNYLNWITTSEVNNDYFVIERMVDNGSWQQIGFVPGGGNTDQTEFYRFQDENVQTGIHYYRLSQVDFDGELTYFESISIENNRDEHLEEIGRYDLLGIQVDKHYKGLVVIKYSNGTSKKVFMP